jgi:DtxR family Mn-dependent transcriptional regulator
MHATKFATGNTAAPAVSLAQEDCLEAVLRLECAQGAARVRDLAAALGVHKSTVAVMLKRLAAAGLVAHARYGLARLTPAGRAIASRTGARHAAIRDFLAGVLLLEPAAADANACRMEHILDAAAHGRVRAATRFLALRPRPAAAWRRAFRGFLDGAEADVPSRRAVGVRP